jgi:serine/threonine protein kinase
METSSQRTVSGSCKGCKLVAHVVCPGLVTSSFNVKVADFGLTAQMRQTGVQGTPLWMAPELLTGHVSTLESDVYAFGILLFEVLALAPCPFRPPFNQLVLSRSSPVKYHMMELTRLWSYKLS